MDLNSFARHWWTGCRVWGRSQSRWPPQKPSLDLTHGNAETHPRRRLGQPFLAEGRGAWCILVEIDKDKPGSVQRCVIISGDVTPQTLFTIQAVNRTRHCTGLRQQPFEDRFVCRTLGSPIDENRTLGRHRIRFRRMSFGGPSLDESEG